MKTCNRCRVEKPDDAFGKRGQGLQPYCRVCNREYQKAHYTKNRETYRVRLDEYTTQYREQTWARILEYLTQYPCVDCGESDPIVLQFDHVRGKKSRNIADMVRNRFGWERIMEEIEKCDVRCANCHCRRTAKQLGWWKHRLAAVDE